MSERFIDGYGRAQEHHSTSLSANASGTSQGTFQDLCSHLIYRSTDTGCTCHRSIPMVWTSDYSVISKRTQNPLNITLVQVSLLLASLVIVKTI